MKKLIASKIFSFILGALIFSGITVFAYSISSRDIAFTPTDPEWQVDNVEDAVNSLYEKSSMKTGELFLKFYGQVSNEKIHESPSHFSYQKYYNLDFSDIKSFDFNLEYTSTYLEGLAVQISGVKTSFSIKSENNINKSYNVEVNGDNNVNISLAIPEVGTLKLAITSYTKIDGTVVSF